MSFLTGTANIVHIYEPPAGTTREIALGMLSDHEFFLLCNPVHEKFEVVPEPSSAPVIPDTVKSRLRSPDTRTIVYTVTDVLHALPAGIWDTNVVSTYEFTNIENGVFVKIKAPLGVILETIWEVRESAESKKLELVDDSTITCNRMLLPIMKNECESGYVKMTPRILAKLADDVKKADAAKGETA